MCFCVRACVSELGYASRKRVRVCNWYKGVRAPLVWAECGTEIPVRREQHTLTLINTVHCKPSSKKLAELNGEAMRYAIVALVQGNND